MRAVGTDHTLVHEQALLDVAAGYASRGRARTRVRVGHSGGGTLNAFYLWQATPAAPADRIA